MTTTRFKMITHAAARKLFVQGVGFYLCPNKLRPGTEWSVEFFLSPESIAEWKENAARYAPGGPTPNGKLWEKDIDTTAWGLMYRNWAYYNTGEGMGDGATFYTAE